MLRPRSRGFEFGDPEERSFSYFWSALLNNRQARFVVRIAENVRQKSITDIRTAAIELKLGPENSHGNAEGLQGLHSLITIIAILHSA